MSGSKQDVAYTFDRVYDGDASNGEVYEESVRDVVRSCVEGFHGSVFAYGQVRESCCIPRERVELVCVAVIAEKLDQ